MPPRTLRPSGRKRLTADDRRDVIERAATEVFAERGYRGASIDEIARRSGITAPVLYDHFASKKALYDRLIDRHYAELRSIWFESAAAGGPLAERLPRTIDAWFGYVGANPFAGRMLFRDTTGDPDIEATHREIQRSSRAALIPLVAREAETAGVDLGGLVDLELAWEVLRAVLQGLALWWYEHPDVPRERIVTTAMNGVWLGFERVFNGEVWEPSAREKEHRPAGRPGDV